MGFSIRRILGSRGGFTLIELLTVVAIIGILATIAVPVFLGQKTKAMQKEAMSNLEALRLLEEQYFAESGAYAADRGACSANNPGNVVLIQEELPAFKPGRGEDLFFSYCIQQNMAINTTSPLNDPEASDPCFVARAFGKTGTQVQGNEFKVDCNNVKTY